MKIGFNRPHFVRALVLAACIAFGGLASAQSDPLPSWNDGPAKKAILDFVHTTTTQGSPNFVPTAERVATFDQDGTLWVEQPMYSQVMFILERVPALVRTKPELAKVAPFSTVLEILKGDRSAIARLTLSDLTKLAGATLSGMPVETFQGEAQKWLAEAKDPRWKKPYTDLTYLPMQEVLKYLRASGYKTYIVTGGGQDFVRAYAEATYGIPPEQVVGTAFGTTYGYGKDGKPIPDQGTETAAQRQQRRQAGSHPPDDRASPEHGGRQLDRRPADARIHQDRRRGTAGDAGPARRCQARICLRTGAGLAGNQGGQLHAAALRRGAEAGLDGRQHEE
jgi:phosphoserine phosphatase